MRERLLWSTSIVFFAGVVMHGADHIRRGVDAVTKTVLVAGTLQFAAAAVAVYLVTRAHRRAPVVAAVVGLAGAVGFALAHLVPYWSSFSDAFVGSRRGAGVNLLSWFTAVFEISADLVFGCVGLAVVIARRSSYDDRHTVRVRAAR